MKTDLPAQRVLAALGWGGDNARSLSDIAEELNWPRRAVEAAVQELRLDGHPIASGAAGVWLGDAVDLAATLEQLRHRLRSQYATVLAMRRTLRRLRASEVHQEELFPAA